MTSPAELTIDWRTENSLPNVAFIKSRHGHQTIADVLVPLFESSPLWSEHVAQIEVHALSSPKALAEGLAKAIKLCEDAGETWVVALVRGGGDETTMANFAETLESLEVRPLLERLAPRLVFAGGHTRDARRYEWLRPKCLAFGEVPFEAGRQFIERLGSDGVLKRAHDAVGGLTDGRGGLPTPDDLPRTRRARELERLALRVRQRFANRVHAAMTVMDRDFIEMIHRGGLLMGFLRVTAADYQGLVFNDNYELHKSDSYYPLDMWRDILESAGVEQWENEEAMEKLDEYPR